MFDGTQFYLLVKLIEFNTILLLEYINIQRPHMVDYKTATSTILTGNTRGTMMQSRSIKFSFYLMSHSL